MRDNALRPTATRNPQLAIRSAFTSSTVLVNTGHGRFVRKPRVIIGSLLRSILQVSDL